MTTPENDPRNQVAQEPPFDPEYDAAYDQAPPANEQAPQGDGQEMLGATGDAQDGNLEKDPSDWVSGDDPATEAQKSYIDSLAKQAGEQIPANLTKAQASEHIDRLKKLTGN
ncbi:DUF3072 family protein [Corynebacterium mucifaciens]|uniref:DUF3072 domain-containing protein n=1 Tax=Corynebacterium ureicelerivorans TaxID=401472 RepID=A0A077HK02_9CORY|nr:hypothetical protein CUREI_04550 [Corynebacterium ureicelerivorans]